MTSSRGGREALPSSTLKTARTQRRFEKSAPLSHFKIDLQSLILNAVAVQAKEHANGMELDGRRIRVDFSITKRAHTPTPGIYMGRPT